MAKNVPENLQRDLWRSAAHFRLVSVRRFAEDVTEDQILKALTPRNKPLTQRLSQARRPIRPPPRPKPRFRYLIAPAHRSLSQTEARGKKIAASVKDSRKIDLEITSTTTRPI